MHAKRPQASLAWGWANQLDNEILAMTVLGNTRSWGLMERLGMVRRPELDFDHPKLMPNDPLLAHIVYSMGRPNLHQRPPNQEAG